MSLTYELLDNLIKKKLKLTHKGLVKEILSHRMNDQEALDFIMNFSAKWLAYAMHKFEGMPLEGKLKFLEDQFRVAQELIKINHQLSENKKHANSQH